MTDLEADIREIRRLVPKDATVVFVSGNFNILHPGHLRLLQFAAGCGDFLVVGVHGNEAPGVTIPLDMRVDGVKALSVVDYACRLPPRLDQFLTELRPQIIVKGKEHEGADNVEQALVESYGGKLLFGSGEVRFSSLDLLEREYRESNFSNIIKPSDFPDRHGFSINGLKALLPAMARLKVAVIGDLIVDEYIDCEPLGMSQEDPTIVVTPLSRKRFVGGAGIVAAHASSLGAEVRFVTVVGEDAIAEMARQRLADFGVRHLAVTDASRPTTLKQRYRASGKTLLRVSDLRQHGVSAAIAAELEAAVLEALPNCDLLVFSDFNYGCLPQQLVEKLTAAALRAKVPMVADSQASSQVSDISRFRNQMLITPTEREARLAMQDGESGLVILASRLQRKAKARNVVVTLGAEGMLIYGQQRGALVTDRLPALNPLPKDPAGAGDSFLVCAAMAMCAGADIWQSSYLGGLAAAVQVSRVGNSPLSRQELIREIDWRQA